MEFKLTIEATELAGAILTLAKAIKENNRKGSWLECGQENLKIQQQLSKNIDDVYKTKKQESKLDNKEENILAHEDDNRTITLEEVRKVLAEKSRSGKQSEVKALILKFGSEKLTGIDPVYYSELIKEVDKL